MKYLILLFLLSCAAVPEKKSQEPILSPIKATYFLYKSSLSWPPKTAEAANCVVNTVDFKKGVESKEFFTYTEDSPSQVYKNIIKKNATIRTYKTKWPFSKAIATTYKSDRENVYFNRRKNPRKMPNMVNTACHEWTHLGGYSHGSNNKSENWNLKKDSVPYWVGSLCEKIYIEKCSKSID